MIENKTNIIMYSHCVPALDIGFWGTQIDAMCGTHPKQVRQ